MPFADPTRRRAYDAARKRKQRAQGWTKKRMDTRLTPVEIETAEDIKGLFNEVVAEVRTAEDSSLGLEAKLRIKLRAVEIGLRVIEITNHEQRIAALEEQSK
ncbi:MAG TPA: hypothetical protein VEF35_02065 [Candidatus Bathyarchaeia archaeon]|nr:hypothetical protein [Candidatus Bathyarchaeia archaeon]